MTTQIVNIPGTTLLIKQEDLVSSHFSAKLVERHSLIPPETSEDNFEIETVKAIVLVINTKYHTIAVDTDAKDGETLKDEIKYVAVNAETIIYDKKVSALTASSFYSELDEKGTEKVDSWTKFFKRHIRWVESLSDMQIELHNAEKASEAISDEMSALDVSANHSNKEIKKRINLLHENLQGDLENHSSRLDKIKIRLFTDTEVTGQVFENAYDVAQYMIDASIVGASDYRNIIRGISKWVSFVNHSLDNSESTPIYGLNFIGMADDTEEYNTTSGTIVDTDDGDDSDTDEVLLEKMEAEEAREKLAKSVIDM